MESITQGLLAEINKSFISKENWYLEIDSNQLGTLKLCFPGQESKIGDSDVRPWLKRIENLTDGEDQSNTIDFILVRKAEIRVMNEPLENHICRIYRYRASWEQRQLTRVGYVWSNQDTTENVNEFYYKVVSNLSLAIEGEVPDRRFEISLNQYLQLPEHLIGNAIPLGLGYVKGWTPPLIKAGGWGYLAQDMVAFDSREFSGAIPIDGYRGQTFSVQNLKQGNLAEELTAAQTYAKINSPPTHYIQDEGTGYAVLKKEDEGDPVYELIKVMDANQTGGNWLDPIYRSIIQNGYFHEPSDFPNNAIIIVVGVIQIDDEILLYKHANGDGLFDILGGINKPPQPHYAGALVREFMPVYRWLISSRRLLNNSLRVSDVKFYLSGVDALVQNPFGDIEVDDNNPNIEPGHRVGTITVFSVYGANAVAINNHSTPGTIGYELLNMNEPVTIEDDDFNQWSDAPLAIDEITVDPMEGDIPETFAKHEGLSTEPTLFQGGQTRITSGFISPPYGSPFWATNPLNASDGDVDTWARIYAAAQAPGFPNYCELMNYFRYHTVGNAANITKVTVATIATWLMPAMPGAAVWLRYNGIEEILIQVPSMQWVTRVIFDFHGGINVEMADYFRNAALYYDWGDPIKIDFHAPSIINDWEKAFGMNDIVLYIERADGTSKLMFANGDDPINNLEHVEFLRHHVYLSEGVWRLTYDEGGDLEIEDTITGGQGWQILNTLAGPLQHVDDTKKEFRVQKLDASNDGKVYEAKMVLHMGASGEWSDLGKAYDGNSSTFASYFAATGATDYAEFNNNSPISSPDSIVKVRIKIKTQGIMSVDTKIGIEVAGGNHIDVDTWYTLPYSGVYTAYIDVTSSSDGPGPDSWEWIDFTNLSIYLKFTGDDGQQMKIFELSWDIVTGSSHIDPMSTPVVLDFKGTPDEWWGEYGGDLIQNPAYVYKLMLLEIKQMSIEKLNLPAFDTLVTHFNNLCVGRAKAAGVIHTVEQADLWLKKFRDEFNFIVIDDKGKLTPKAFPSLNDDAVAILDLSNIIPDTFRRKRTGMEEVCNFPIAHYAPKYYNSDRNKTIIFTTHLEQLPLIQKQWPNPFNLSYTDEKLQKQWKNTLDIEDMTGPDVEGNDWGPYWDLAYASFLGYNERWFKRAFTYDFVFDAETARALIANKIPRFATQRWQFGCHLRPIPGELLSKYDVVWVAHPYIPRIPGLCQVAGTYPGGHYFKVKCVILSIKPVSSTRRAVELEVLKA